VTLESRIKSQVAETWLKGVGFGLERVGGVGCERSFRQGRVPRMKYISI